MVTDSSLIAALRAKGNALRIDSIRATTQAGSGHPTTCMSAADIMSVIFLHVMKWDPKDPQNKQADRFVLSKGHAAPVLYAAWKQSGAITDEQMMSLREITSNFEGHPTPRLPFVDVATGSLGQGLGAGVGLALNSKYLDRTNYRTYVLLGDGEIAEGAVWEAAQMASYYKLDNLVAIVDANRLGQSQATAVGHDVEVYRARFEAFGWESIVIDGHDIPALVEAFETASKTQDKPFAIIAKTYKGQGVSTIADKDAWHGKPFKKDEAEVAIGELKGKGAETDYKFQIEKPSGAAPTQAGVGVMDAPAYKADDQIATREAYGIALAKLGAANHSVVGLDADTKNSTFSDKFMKAFPDRFFECFIAEQNMISVAAGLSSRGKIPFASTFAVFLSRGFDQVRMAGVSGNNIKLCGSHVGVSIGEDGPSQMGLEDIALYRTIPGAVVFYPSDGVSAEWAVRLASEHQGLCYIRTSRPKTNLLYKNDEQFEIGKAKVVRRGENDALTIATGGITVFEALKAADLLKESGISLRIIDLFTIKPLDAETLISNGKETGNLILTVEDHYLEGGIGEAVCTATCHAGIMTHRIGVTNVPRSGAPDELVSRYGLDAASIAQRVKEILGK